MAMTFILASTGHQRHVRGAAHLGGPEAPLHDAQCSHLNDANRLASHGAKCLHRDARGKTQKSASRSIHVTLSGFMRAVTAERILGEQGCVGLPTRESLDRPGDACLDGVAESRPAAAENDRRLLRRRAGASDEQLAERGQTITKLGQQMGQFRGNLLGPRTR